MKIIERKSIGLCVVLLLIAGATIAPYAFRPSSLLHLDATVAQMNPPPAGTVILDVPAYDGAQYYQLARIIPEITSAEGRDKGPTSYAYQRILLPVLGFIFSFRQDAALPSVLLLLNLLSLIGSYFLITRYASLLARAGFALALSPAALIGLHFSLAEPLSIFLTTLVLVRLLKNDRITIIDTLLLSLLILTREVNILFVGAIGITTLARMRWKDAVMLVIPTAVFITWQWVLSGWFGDIPFLMSSAKSGLPFAGMLTVLMGATSVDSKILSSIAFMFLFLLPAIVLTGKTLMQKRKPDVILWPLAMLLLVMVLLPALIWGSITSVGRVITPVYPLLVLAAARNPSQLSDAIMYSMMILGLTTAIGLAFIVHPFTLA